MCVSCCFAHFRLDVVAITNDQVFGSAYEPEIAIRVLKAHISRIKPALLNPQLLIVLLIDVAREDVGTLDDNAAHFVACTVTPIRSCACELHRLHQLIGEAQANRANSFFTVPRVDPTNRGRFRQTVPFEDISTRPCLTRTLELLPYLSIPPA